MLWALGEHEGPVFEPCVGPGVEEQPVFAVGEEEQHAFEPDVTLEHDRESPVVASGTSIFMLSNVAVERLFYGLATVWSLNGDSSVVCVTQQQGVRNLGFSAVFQL